MSIGERRYRDLQKQARTSGRTTQDLLTLYVLEGFLSRVAESDHKSKLVLKGGVLLAALGARRPTGDLDFAATQMKNDAGTILKICLEIASIQQEDGIEFQIENATAEIIREDNEYSGIRVRVPASIHTARVPFGIDLSVGDPIQPPPSEINIPRLLDENNPIRVLGYPISMVYAEKIVTALQRGVANTRWRDFGDAYNLCRLQPVSYLEMRESFEAVAGRRKVELTTFKESLGDYSVIGQDRYGRWRINQDRLDLPASFAELLDFICAFVDPMLSRTTNLHSVWDHISLQWK